MSNSTWITDRPPTAADADEHGKVSAQMPCGFLKGKPWSISIEWGLVPTGTPWRHTSLWGTAPTTTPRLFTSITYSDDCYLAVADDGTAWEKCGRGWVQLPPLPAREVGQ